MDKLRERFKHRQHNLKMRLETFMNYPKSAAYSKEDPACNGFNYIWGVKDDNDTL